MNMGT